MAVDRSRRAALTPRAAALAGLAMALSMASCSHAPDPTPTPRPTPSPTVVSVVAPFQAAIQSKTFQFEGVVTGTVSSVAKGSVTDHPVSGTFLYKGGDYSWRLSTWTGGSNAAADETTTVQYWAVGKYRYQCDEFGHWTRDARPTGSRTRGLAAVFFVNRPLEDLGIEPLRGQQLHKLAWADGPGVASSVVDFQGQLDVSGMLVRVYFWADDQGQPAGLTYRISEPVSDGTTEADMVWNLDVVFTSLSGVKIAAPST